MILKVILEWFDLQVRPRTLHIKNLLEPLCDKDFFGLMDTF